MAKFDKRVIYLRAEQQRETLLALVRNLPLDADKPLQVTIEGYRPARKLDQNALYWAGPLKDIADQAWFNGKQYSAEVWHELLKRELLPENDMPDFDTSLARDGYRKWDFGPDGQGYLVGTTTMLTVRGMAQYIEQVHAFGSSLGVSFHEKP